MVSLHYEAPSTPIRPNRAHQGFGGAAFNWRLLLALAFNLAIWALIFKIAYKIL